MIRRIIHAELSDVRALAAEAKRRAVNTWHHNFFASAHRKGGSVILGPGSGLVGFGFTLAGEDPQFWPDGVRVTLAAWVRARKDGAT